MTKHPWKSKRLDEIAKEIRSGGTPKADNPAYYGGGIPFATIEDMSASKKIVTSTKKTITEAGLAQSTAREVPKGAILYSIYATLGLARIAGTKLTTNQAILNIVVDDNKVDNEFLYYWLQNIRPTVLRLAGHTTQANLSATTVKAFPIPLPRLPEQRVISSILADVDQIIFSTEQVIRKQERVRAGLLRELLSRGIDDNGELRAPGDREQLMVREMVPLRSICRKITKGTTPSTIGGRYCERGIPYVRVEAISMNGEILSNKLLFIDISTHQLLSRSIIKRGDILFSIAGAIGRTAVVEDCFEMNCNQAVAIIRPDSNQIDSSFLRVWLSSVPVQRAVNDQVVQLAQANFSLAMLGEVQIPRLDKDEQLRIVTAIKNWDDATSDAKKQLTKIKSIKTGLMRDLLSGRISVEPLLADRTPHP
jgi:type I restriction enzyme, S subunit